MGNPLIIHRIETNESMFFKHVEDQSLRSEALARTQPPEGMGGPELGGPGSQCQVLCTPPRSLPATRQVSGLAGEGQVPKLKLKKTKDSEPL